MLINAGKYETWNLFLTRFQSSQVVQHLFQQKQPIYDFFNVMRWISSSNALFHHLVLFFIMKIYTTLESDFSRNNAYNSVKIHSIRFRKGFLTTIATPWSDPIFHFHEYREEGQWHSWHPEQGSLHYQPKQLHFFQVNSLKFTVLDMHVPLFHPPPNRWLSMIPWSRDQKSLELCGLLVLSFSLRTLLDEARSYPWCCTASCQEARHATICKPRLLCFQKATQKKDAKLKNHDIRWTVCQLYAVWLDNNHQP